MSLPPKPAVLPRQPSFSSGPCPKRPGWSAETVAAKAHLGRSHRAAAPKAQLAALIERLKRILGVPDGHRLGIVPASDTGAFELAMWTMLGARPVDMLVWESFGAGWASDAVKQLRLPDCQVIEAGYGALPDLSAIRAESDVCFTQNGTTSGVRIPDFDWLAPDRPGLAMNDATSAAFAQPIDWAKVDVLTFSWQKVLGGEAAHGVLVLSPKAVARLESYVPDRPLPKIFRLTKGGKLNEAIFEGATINTPSMLAVADCVDALDWVEEIGGVTATQARSDANVSALQAWVDRTPWVENLVAAPALRSNTSVCLSIVDPTVAGLEPAAVRDLIKRMVKRLDAEGAAHDIGGYRDAPPGLRIWCGATVETSDIEALTPWLDWAFAAAKAELAAA
ncbi:MAG: phosphoserine transaminase [Pseudomonadota bacterium]